jgi:hypothetical protein
MFISWTALIFVIYISNAVWWFIDRVLATENVLLQITLGLMIQYSLRQNPDENICALELYSSWQESDSQSLVNSFDQRSRYTLKVLTWKEPQTRCSHMNPSQLLSSKPGIKTNIVWCQSWIELLALLSPQPSLQENVVCLTQKAMAHDTCEVNFVVSSITM